MIKFAVVGGAFLFRPRTQSAAMPIFSITTILCFLIIRSALLSTSSAKSTHRRKVNGLLCMRNNSDAETWLLQREKASKLQLLYDTSRYKLERSLCRLKRRNGCQWLCTLLFRVMAIQLLVKIGERGLPSLCTFNAVTLTPPPTP